MNTYRRLLAEAILANGGYSSGYDRWPLAWNVKDYSLDTRFAKLIEAAKELYHEYHAEKLQLSPDTLKALAKKWDSPQRQESTYYRVFEDLRDGVTDDDTYRTLRPDIERRYGLDLDELAMRSKFVAREGYRAARKRAANLSRSCNYFNVKFVFAGRQGGHLVIDTFEGVRLWGSTAKATAEDLMTQETNYSNDWAQRLLAMVQEWDLCFTRQNVADEAQHQAAYRLMTYLEEEVESEKLLDLHMEGL